MHNRPKRALPAQAGGAAINCSRPVVTRGCVCWSGAFVNILEAKGLLPFMKPRVLFFVIPELIRIYHIGPVLKR